MHRLRRGYRWTHIRLVRAHPVGPMTTRARREEGWEKQKIGCGCAMCEPNVAGIRELHAQDRERRARAERGAPERRVAS